MKSIEDLRGTEEYRRFVAQCDEIKDKLKPNPNGYPIIDKWNDRNVYVLYRRRIFFAAQELAGVAIMAAYEDRIKDFADIRDIKWGSKP